MSSKPFIETEFDFVLPKGLIDGQNNIHRYGKMRLATARDEIMVQRNSRAQDNPAYASLVMLAQVITQLGDIVEITAELLENLFSHDLAFLREFYNRINQQGDVRIPVECPHCSNQFKVEMALSGEF